MENLIKISVIVPVYNIQRYIGRCLKSIVGQSLQDIEVIVVNDGSEDASRDRVESFAQKDSRIIVIDKQNGGLSSARNAGLDIATGEYILHIDGDDWIEQGCLEELYNKALMDDLDVVVADYWKDYDNGSKKYVADMPIGENDIIDGRVWMEYFFARKATQSVFTKLVRRSLYSNVRHPEHISMGEDLATIPRVMYKTQRIGKLNKAYYRYIQRAGSIVNSVSMVNTEKTVNSLVAAFTVLQDFFCHEQDILTKLEKHRIAQLAIFIFTPKLQRHSSVMQQLQVEYIIKNRIYDIRYSIGRVTCYSYILKCVPSKHILSLLQFANSVTYKIYISIKKGVGKA